jgi:predicted O-methyltransferase YrrM
MLFGLYEPHRRRKMKRILVVVGTVLALALGVSPQRRGPRGGDSTHPPLPKSDAEKRILDVLERVVQSHETYLSVPIQDGRALRLLAEAIGAKQVVEIGTSTGYSGLWFCLALRATGGRLTTFEIDHQRASLARAHFKEAGVDTIATVVEGDAHAQVVRLKGPIDLVFIDADKDGYVDYLNKLLPLVRPGGFILAHNIDVVPDYVRAVTTDPNLETIFYQEGAGLGITLKKR